MFNRWESSVFAITLMGAASLLFSIAVGEVFLAAALVIWIVWRPRRLNIPSFFVPLCAFLVLTFVSLLFSPQPAIGWAIRKTAVFAMALLASTFVTNPLRARSSYAILLTFATAASVIGFVQLGLKYVRFVSAHQLFDDPRFLVGLAGSMEHWQTLNGQQLLVWCAAIPATISLGRRWFGPITIVGAALILSFAQGVWAGATAAAAFVSVMIPKRLLIPILLPLVIIGVTASGVIYYRITAAGIDSPHDTRRMEVWKVGLQMIREHPWFGVGPERIPVEFSRHYRGTDVASVFYGHFENDFLQIAAERGLLCVATLIWFFLELYAGLFRLMRSAAKDSRWIAISAVAALTGFVVSGLFGYNFGDSQVLLLMLFIVAMPFGVLQLRPETSGT